MKLKYFSGPKKTWLFLKAASLIFRLPVAACFSFLLLLRAYYYRIFSGSRLTLPGVTISIGNVVMGGGGKTPFTIALGEYLLARGKHPAILTRGYKSGLRSGESVVICDGIIKTEDHRGHENLMLDEPLLISHALKGVPIIVGNKRGQNATRFLKSQSHRVSHWILDDGFQHLKINRNIDIVLFKDFHLARPLWLFPLGILREPLIALKRCHYIGIGKTSDDKNKDLDKILGLPVNYFFYENAQSECDFPDLKKESLKLVPSMEVVIASAIAENRQFLEDVRQKFQVKVVDHYALGDHKNMDFSLLKEKIGSCKNLVVTAKDYFREAKKFQTLRDEANISIHVITLTARVDAITLENLAHIDKM